MPNDLPILNQVRIPQPCPVSWDEMTGDDRSRHCSQCDTSVVNLSNMTAAEAAAFLQEHRGRCVRVIRKPDGSIVTWPEPGKRRRFVRRLIAGLLVPMLLVLPGCSRENQTPAFADWLGVEQPEPELGEMTGEMTEVGYEEPMPFDMPDTP